MRVCMSKKHSLSHTPITCALRPHRRTDCVLTVGTPDHPPSHCFHTVFTPCSHRNAHRFTPYSHRFHIAFTPCSHRIHIVFPPCSHRRHTRSHPIRAPAPFTSYSHRFHTVFTLCSHRLTTVFTPDHAPTNRINTVPRPNTRYSHRVHTFRWQPAHGSASGRAGLELYYDTTLLYL